MTSDDRLRSIYLAAAALPAESVGAYLDRVCGDDAELRGLVERMLAARAAGPDFMEHTTYDVTAEVSVAAPTQGSSLGRYRILNRLGEGAFGTVFQAEQREPVVRRVALKMLHEKHTGPNVLARFEAERQALALMEHPHIATILDAGSDESGRPYFVMEMVPGRPITGYCEEKRLTIRQRLEVFEQVCHAAQHAHTKGIIHRDLKPSNILVTNRDGHPHTKVIDFGIAKATQMRLTPHTLFTADHAFIGTPEYMSPEQVTGSPDIDTRTDVYSLGVLLYELLVGATPFGTAALREAGFIEMVRHIRETDPVKPSALLGRLSAEGESGDSGGAARERLRKIAEARGTEPRQLMRSVRGELDVIVMKALEKNPGRRYQTASELAQDIRRYLDGQPILAAPHTAWYWVSKMARRHRPVFATAGASVAVLVLVAVVALVGWSRAYRANAAKQRAYEELETSSARETEARVRAEAQRLRAQESAQQAAEERVRAEREAYRANIRVGEVAQESGERQAMRDAIAACNENLRGWEWNYLQSGADRSVMVLRGHRGAVTGAAFLGSGGLVATGSIDGFVRIFDAAGGVVEGMLDTGTPGSVMVRGGEDAARVLTGDGDGVVRVWDLRESGQGRVVLDLSGEQDPTINGVAWNDRGGVAVAGCDDGTVRVFGTGAEGGGTRVIGAFRAGVTSVGLSDDGERLIATGAGGGVRVYRVDSGELEHTLETRAGYPAIDAELLAGDRAATVDSGGVVRIWDLHDLYSARGRVDLNDSAYAMAVSPDSRLLAVACAHGVALLDTVGELRQVSMYRGHDGASVSASFSSDSTRVVTGSLDGTARIWDVYDSDDRLHLPGTRRWTGREVSADGSMIALVRGRHVEVRDIGTGELVSLISGAELWPGAAGFTPDGRRVLVYTDTARAQWTGDGAVFDALTGEPLGKLKDLREMPAISPGEPLVNAQGFHEAVFSPAGDRVAVRAMGWKAVVYDWATGQQVFALTGHTDGVRAVSFSPDGLQILTESTDGTAKLWGARDGSLRLTLDGRAGPILGACFSPNSRYVVTSSAGSKVAVWRTSDGSRVSEADVDQVTRLVGLSDDGRTLLARETGAIVVIATASGEVVSRIPLSREDSPVRLSPDGTRLVCVSADGQVELWDTARGDHLLTLREHDADPDFVTFALGGSAVVSGDWGMVRVWDSRSAIERAEAVRGFIESRAGVESRVRAALDAGAPAQRVRDELIGEGAGADLSARIAMSAVVGVLGREDAGAATGVGGESAGGAGSESSPSVLAARDDAEREGNSPQSLTRLGVALYNDRQYEHALGAFHRSERIYKDLRPNPDRDLEFWMPENGGYIAMSLWQLGRKEEALAAIESVRELIAKEHTACDCVRYLEAALEVVNTGTDPAPAGGAGDPEETE